jgi:polygalacturonase
MGLAAHPDAQVDSGVQQAWLDAGGGAAAVRGGLDTPAPGAASTHPSRPMTSADLAAPGFSMPARQAHQAPVVAPAPIITDEGVTTRDFGAGAPVSRQERRAAEKAAKQAAARGGGRGGQGSSRGGRGAGGAGAGARAGQGIDAV